MNPTASHKEWVSQDPHDHSGTFFSHSSCRLPDQLRRGNAIAPLNMTTPCTTWWKMMISLMVQF